MQVANKWIIPNHITDFDAALIDRISAVKLPAQQFDDRLVWKDSIDGILTSKLAYQFPFPAPANNWIVPIWFKHIPPSNSFVVWRCLHEKMPIDENLMKHGCTIKFLFVYYAWLRYYS
jgi:hypothetical protein